MRKLRIFTIFFYIIFQLLQSLCHCIGIRMCADCSTEFAVPAEMRRLLAQGTAGVAGRSSTRLPWPMPAWSVVEAVAVAVTVLAGDVTAIDAASWWAQEMAERHLMVGTDTSWREFAYCWTA